MTMMMKIDDIGKLKIDDFYQASVCYSSPGFGMLFKSWPGSLCCVLRQDTLL